jgi:SAM-dependent methyltransferase
VVDDRAGPTRPAEIAAARAFFAPRAADWEERFPDDDPLYAAAISELNPSRDAVALDVACGSGRALPVLRAAVGPGGTVLGIDVTAEMLAEAHRRGRSTVATLVLADVLVLPLADESVDAVFGAGLVPHLGDPVDGLRELARVSRPGARLALFHAVGRATLSRRHGHPLDPDDVRTEARIRPVLAASGWRCELVDDGDDRYLVLAVRQERLDPA